MRPDICCWPTGRTLSNGLTNIEDRLDALGGTLRIVSTPGEGTTLRAAIPVPTPRRTPALHSGDTGRRTPWSSPRVRR